MDEQWHPLPFSSWLGWSLGSCHRFGALQRRLGWNSRNMTENSQSTTLGKYFQSQDAEKYNKNWPNDLIKVTSSRSRVGEREANCFLWVNDEDGSDLLMMMWAYFWPARCSHILWMGGLSHHGWSRLARPTCRTRWIFCDQGRQSKGLRFNVVEMEVWIRGPTMGNWTSVGPVVDAP